MVALASFAVEGSVGLSGLVIGITFMMISWRLQLLGSEKSAEKKEDEFRCKQCGTRTLRTEGSKHERFVVRLAWT